MGQFTGITLADDADADRAGARAPEGMGGLAKGLAVIESFARTRRTLTVAAAAREAGLSRASARRCLLTLADLGYIRQAGSAFMPTPRMLRLGEAYFESTSLPQLAQPHLDAARDRLDESISLAVWEDDQAVFVARAEVARPATAFVRLGSKLPGYASATGRVLLAEMPDDALDAYLARTELRPLSRRTHTDPDRIRAFVLETRETGHAVSCEELELGMLSIAVPVKGTKGHTLAAMSISALLARVSARQAEAELLPALRESATALSRML